MGDDYFDVEAMLEAPYKRDREVGRIIAITCLQCACV